MKTNYEYEPGTWKVRRATLGCKRAVGREWQDACRRVRRANVKRLGRGPNDRSLSAIGGLVDFNAFLQKERFGAELAQRFGHLKRGRGVVYPMHTQLQLLIDAAVVGAHRVFDLEWLALDPVFVHLAGGAVPSVDVIYDDLRRFEPDDVEALSGGGSDLGRDGDRAQAQPTQRRRRLRRSGVPRAGVLFDGLDRERRCL